MQKSRSPLSSELRVHLRRCLPTLSLTKADTQPSVSEEQRFPEPSALPSAAGASSSGLRLSNQTVLLYASLFKY